MRSPSASHPDLVILGAGIAGLSAALAAADRGARVMVLDRPRSGAASRASAGMLAPSVEGLPATVLAAAIAARDSYPAYLAMLRDRTGIDVALERAGILELASDQRHFERLATSARGSVTVLGAEALAQLEPALAGHAGALLHAGDGSVDNVRLMDALDAAARLCPDITRVGAEIAGVELGGAPAFVASDGARFHAPRLLVASGAWAASLEGLPRPLAVRPVRGQLLLLDVDPVRHVIYGGGGYAVPRGGRLLIGATSEEAGWVSEVTSEGRASLLAIASGIVPSLASAPVSDHWAGLRPMSPDGLPIIGEDPDEPALLYSCGYSRNGILFAPWCAGHLAAVIAGEGTSLDLGRFAVDRRSLLTPGIHAGHKSGPLA